MSFGHIKSNFVKKRFTPIDSSQQSILFGSASRVSWDKLTVIEMVQDSESVSQRDWFISHIF